MTTDYLKKLQQKTTAIEKTLHYYLATIYRKNKAWTLTAWPMEILADEQLPQPYTETVKKLRRNLYTYISSLGAEWSADEENTILLPGTYLEAAKALKALWLSLHLAHLTPIEAPATLPPPEEAYRIYTDYMRLHRAVVKLKPVPFKIADRMLGVAAMVSLLGGKTRPEDIENTGATVLVADMIWTLTKTLAL